MAQRLDGAIRLADVRQLQEAHRAFAPPLRMCPPAAGRAALAYAWFGKVTLPIALIIDFRCTLASGSVQYGPVRLCSRFRDVRQGNAGEGAKTLNICGET
ncbi:hypothetical protein Acid7E03_36550 [Acidisoma sp. 7E03]